MIQPRFAPARVREVLASPKLEDPEVAKLRGFFPEPSWYDTVLPMDGESTRGLLADGSTLFVILRGALSAGALHRAWAGLHAMNAPPLNRGSAAGRDGRGRTFKGFPVGRNGKRSGTNMIPHNTIKHLRLGHSGVIGALDREDRYPYCRLTSANGSKQERLIAVAPLAHEVEELFSYALPDRYVEQREIANRTCPAWLVDRTCFTTITVNRNFQCGTHQDTGDFKPGASNLIMIRSGEFSGGHLVLPKYRVAIELNTGDALFFDPHEWHGTSPIEGLHRRYERMTLVMYFRTGMADCGTPEEEAKRAGRLAGAMDLK